MQERRRPNLMELLEHDDFSLMLIMITGVSCAELAFFLNSTLEYAKMRERDVLERSHCYSSQYLARRFKKEREAGVYNEADLLSSHMEVQERIGKLLEIVGFRNAA
jgi:hypothetical protein